MMRRHFERTSHPSCGHPSHEPLPKQCVRTPLTRPAGTLSPRRTRGEGRGENSPNKCAPCAFEPQYAQVVENQGGHFEVHGQGCAFGFMAGEQVRKEQVAFHEPAVERSVHAAGTFAPQGRWECSSRIRWVGPGSSLKAALQNLRHSRPSRRRPPEGGVPLHGDKARNECSGNSLPIGWGRGEGRSSQFERKFESVVVIDRNDGRAAGFWSSFARFVI